MLLALLPLCLAAAAAASPGRTSTLFDSGWTFHRGRCEHAASAPHCSMPSFDDRQWRPVNLPHDWSIEDLPSREEDTEFPVIGGRYGDWKVKLGDGNWSAPDLDDSGPGWLPCKGGEDWRTFGPEFEAANLTGWYRQHFGVSDALARSTATVTLSLGTISGTDVTYLNGVQIGATGRFDSPAAFDYVTLRAYAIPAGLLVAGADNVIAVRSKTIGGPGEGPADGNGSFPGGLYDDPIAPISEARVGPFDPAAALGSSLVEGVEGGQGGSTGFTLGGVGWYV